MTDKQVEQVIAKMDEHHVEVMTIKADVAEVKADVAEIDAKLDTKADAVDRDGFATTLGLDDVEEV